MDRFFFNFSSTMMYNIESVTTEDLLKIAVGDFNAFSYIGVSSTVRMFFS